MTKLQKSIERYFAAGAEAVGDPAALDTFLELRTQLSAGEVRGQAGGMTTSLDFESPVRLKATAPILPSAFERISARRKAADELWHSSPVPATGEPASSCRNGNAT